MERAAQTKAFKVLLRFRCMGNIVAVRRHSGQSVIETVWITAAAIASATLIKVLLVALRYQA
jgi:hypothetical protein